MIKTLALKINQFITKLTQIDFLVLLAIRIYLLPVIFTGARSKILNFDATVAWFAMPTSQGGLHMPFPTLMAALATGTEAAGLVLLALGLFTRLLTIPLMFLISVAV